MKHFYNTLLFFLITLLFSETAFAQTSSDKIVIGITSLSCPDSKNKVYLKEVNEIISSAFVSSNRFLIVDRTDMEKINQERELQKSEDFIDSKVVEQGKSIGASFILTGVLSSVSKSSYYSQESQRYFYKSKILVSLKLINVKTGEITESKTLGVSNNQSIFGVTFSSSCNGEGIGNSEGEAVQAAVASVNCMVKKWVSETFPFEIAVVRLEKASGSKAKFILAGAGSGYGLKRGQELGVFEEVKVTFDGKELTRKKQIGIARVVRVEDDNFSLCEVLEGPKTILERLENNVKLTLTTN